MTRPTWDDTWFAVAQAVSRRSLCVRDQVGAVIVTAKNRIVSTGYNGPPSGFTVLGGRGDDDLFTGKPCSAWCTRAKASIIMQRNLPGLKLQEDYSDCPSLHAEANALSVCDRSVREGGTIYVTSHTCMGCAKLIANSGLTTLHVYPGLEAAHRNPTQVYEFLERCGITVYID